MGNHTQNLLTEDKQSTKTCFKINTQQEQVLPFQRTF